MACVLAATPCILEMQHTEDTWPPEQPAGGPRGRSTPSPGRRSSRAGRRGLRAGKPGQAREGEAGPAGEQGRPGLRATQAWLEDRLAKLWMILMLRVEWSECDVRQLPASLPAYASEAVGCAMFLRLKQPSVVVEPRAGAASVGVSVDGRHGVADAPHVHVHVHASGVCAGDAMLRSSSSVR